MMHRAIALSALLVAAAVGCNKTETPAPTTEAPPATPAVQPTAPAPAPEPVIDADSLPVEEQYEAEAEKEITVDNLTAKLDELEKELAAP
jgi:hypothetical protein